MKNRNSNTINNSKIRIRTSKMVYPLSWHSMLATWFYVGKIPFAPGTFGSIASLPIFLFIIHYTDNHTLISTLLLLIAVFLSWIGNIAIEKFQRYTRTYDHGSIVIDEVIGMLITIAFSYHCSLKIIDKIFQNNHLNLYDSNLIVFLIGFIFFRFYDIRKPLLIKWAEKNFRSAFGVILDDIVAAIFAAISIIIVGQIF